MSTSILLLPMFRRTPPWVCPPVAVFLAFGMHPEPRADPTLAFELIAIGALPTGVTFGRDARLGWCWRKALAA